MSHHLDDAVKYINQHRAHYSDQQIRDHMAKHGWDEHWIGRAFAHAGNPALPSQKKYKVINAIDDSFEAMRKNLATFILSIVLGLGIVVVSGLVLITAVSGLVAGIEGFASPSSTAIWPTVLFILILLTFWYAVAYSFLMSCTSIALWDGSHGHKSSTKSVLKRALAAAVRVAGANALLYILVFWPSILAVLVPVLALAYDWPLSTVWLTLLAIVAWLVIVLLRYPLAPYVVLFEPNVSIWKSLGRSKHLLQKGGQWFLVKGFLFALSILLIVAAFSPIDSYNNDEGNSLLSLVLIVLSIIINACLVMLYKNRRAVRG